MLHKNVFLYKTINNMKILKSLSILTFSIISFSCQHNSDNIPPIMDIISISPSLETAPVCGTSEINNVIKVSTGDSLKFTLKLSDAGGLSQLKIDIHENFDCHGHKTTINPWQLLEIVDLDGSDLTINKSIKIPDNATAGSYHFQLRVLDMSGNETGGTQAYSIIVKNAADTVSPTLIISNPTTALSISKGNTLMINGRVSDNIALDGGRMELVYFTPSGNRVLAQTIIFESNTGNSYNFDIIYSIPLSLSTGDYDFQLRVYDYVGNSVFSDYMDIKIE